jgi:hypothetical protein
MAAATRGTVARRHDLRHTGRFDWLKMIYGILLMGYFWLKITLCTFMGFCTNYMDLWDLCVVRTLYIYVHGCVWDVRYFSIFVHILQITILYV